MVRTCKPVEVEASVISAPIAPCTLLPAGAPGAVCINGTVYSLCYITERDSEGCVQVVGYRLMKGTADTYDLPEDLQTCECKDALYRSRPGGCKHVRGLHQLRDSGVIA